MVLGLASASGLASSREPQVAIFQDDIPVDGAPASPSRLSHVLQSAGMEVAFLSAEQLQDSRQLNHEKFDVLVLPYGASFPVRAADNFRDFLRHGGKFLSTGGYAFDRLWERGPAGWQPPPPPAPPEVEQAVWTYRIPAAAWRGAKQIKATAFLKALNVAGPGMAYLAIYQYDERGGIVQWKDFAKVQGTADWQSFTYRFQPQPGAVRIELYAGLYHCGGTAWIDDVELTTEAGQSLLSDGFESDFNPDQDAEGRWRRSSGRDCRVQDTTQHSGRHALEARLTYNEPRPERLNTRHGRPGDGLEVAPTQLGVFDADYHLERVTHAEPAADQCVLKNELKLDGPLAGWAASGVAGWDAARWLPLVNGYDRYGRLRGAVGALLRHYAGPFAGSSWAYFGVTNRDVFAESVPGAAEALVAIVRDLAQDTYLASLVSEPACYRAGESVKLVARVFNGGRVPRNLRFTARIQAGEPEDDQVQISQRGVKSALPPAAELGAEITVASGALREIALEWKPARFEADFYRVQGQLWDGRTQVDCLASGFVVWNDGVIARGPALKFHHNYLHLGRRSQFLFGTDDWGYTFGTSRETPLQWLRDMRQRRDFGVQIYENLQFGLPKDKEKESLLRKVDGITQLAQKYQQVYFAGLLVGANVAVDSKQLLQQAAYCGEFARRYHRVPGLIYYFNGDLRCELSEAVTPELNEFLRTTYGSEERLRTAWGARNSQERLGAISATEFAQFGAGWDDLRGYDLNRFRAWLIRRWSGALIRGVREFDPAHPTSSEFYQLPSEGVDIPAAIGELDLCNFGYFDKPGRDLARFPLICQYNDQRARGKSVGPGEFGVKTHPAWSEGGDYGYHQTRTREQAVDLFLAIGHYSLGLGGSRAHNWCWKDGAHSVFPWGMVYPCDSVPKETAYAYRNQSLLFRQFAPVYHAPSAYVLTADSHRLGNSQAQVIEGILKSCELALATHAEQLGTLNEQDLTIPKAAKAIFYPIPFCPDDSTYAKLLDWVRAGGTLYVSGDISYDEGRRRTRTARLEELCGVRFMAERYPNILLKRTGTGDQPCIQVEAAGGRILQRTSNGDPLWVEHQVGHGKVLYTTDPIELHSGPARQASDLRWYRRVLDMAGVKRIGLTPDDASLQVFQVPLQDGGRVLVLFNTDDLAVTKRIKLSEVKPPLEVSVAGRRPALLWWDGRGRLRAVEAVAVSNADGSSLLHDSSGGSVVSLDGADLRRSAALLVMPLRAGEIQLASHRSWQKAQLAVGDLRNGTWWNHESIPLNVRGEGWRVSVDSDQACSLLLITEEGAGKRWAEAVSRSVSAPGS